MRSIRELNAEPSAGEGNYPANSSSVEFGGFRFGLFQRGYIRIRALPQFAEFRVGFVRRLAEPDIDSGSAAPNFASGADQQFPTMPASVENF